jgi:hypothetical protein
MRLMLLAASFHIAAIFGVDNFVVLDCGITARHAPPRAAARRRDRATANASHLCGVGFYCVDHKLQNFTQ